LKLCVCILQLPKGLRARCFAILISHINDIVSNKYNWSYVRPPHTIITVRSFIHSIGRMLRFLAVLRSFFHSSLLRNVSCHPSTPTILPSSLTSYYHLFLGPPLNLVVSKFIHDILLGIPPSSILCTSPKQCNLFNLIVFIIVGFVTIA